MLHSCQIRSKKLPGQRLLPWLLTLLAFCATASEPLQIPTELAQRIGQKIWQNEGLGKVENLTVWNQGEDFPSLGIGHFIWYPAGVEGPFSESFPALLDFIQISTPLPPWLADQRDAPWPDRNAFYADIDSPRMEQLRTFLLDTIPQQTQFIVRRLQASLPKMTATLNNAQQRHKVEREFNRLAHSPQGLYALIDYVNFKGEGTSLQERYQDEGWGLLQVLLAMGDDAADPVEAFVQAADRILTRRVELAPRNEQRWLPGWRKRVRSYLDEP